ncbi:Ivy family c-type lysozyme inhibitor [Rhizobium sp. SGZ-381]|uniref:Ivy family c-type lysozyme inhibitor n=1 Tax=Rhizobium sp. SGZ-381 TaxID=3342800 RepID=UPI00367306E6
MFKSMALALLAPTLALAQPAGPAPAVSAPAPTAASTQAVKSGRYLHEVIASSPAHEATLRQLLRPAPKLPSWVRNMVATTRYVSGASEAVEVDGQPFELFGACLPRQCAESRMRLVFSPDGRQAMALIADARDGEILLGSPPPAVLTLLRKPGI